MTESSPNTGNDHEPGSLSPDQLAQPFTRGKTIHTARQILRRMLEHQWEHLLELHQRLS